MMRRKFEEDDWAHVYCHAKKIPKRGWSNLNIDVMHQGLGVEHKMLRSAKADLKELYGTSLMHPSATRSIRVPSTDTDPQIAMRAVLSQYADLIARRRLKVQQDTPNMEPDMRTGWLIWQSSLRQFLYFEEEMLPPDPNDYYADDWKESGGRGARKASKSLWIYERETGRKRYSITTSAGAKIQPYFDIPPPNDSHVYLFTTQGETVEEGIVKVWVTAATARDLQNLLGDLEIQVISTAILNAAEDSGVAEEELADAGEIAQSILITAEAYDALYASFAGVSDEHMVQLLVRRLRQR